ncbi:organic cation transporter protein-like isoform X2 [Planococcus citri]|uniref:organic cation transporter protein-like isoform X2 n=1 Tax=Planococcus citri TaxID=170843 RepID=UPI0031F72461
MSSLNRHEEDPRRKWKSQLDSVLENICNTKRKWLWLVFLVTASPGILNGMHITSYVFFVDNNPPYCHIPALEKANWTVEQIRNISSPITNSAQDQGCWYYDWNYDELAEKSFEESKEFLSMIKAKPDVLPCTDYRYENYNSVISEWDLVCDRYYYRSNIQASYALGKFFGASFFGIIADKIGRKSSFTLAALCYVASAFLSAASSWFCVFLLIRFLLGFAGVGCYSTAYTLLSETMVGSSKTWVCCLFNASYAVGMIILSFLANHVQYWKTLQILMSIPTIILPFYYWLLPESPQWLLSKGRPVEAWDVVRKIDSTVVPPADLPRLYCQVPINTDESSTVPRKSLYQKLLQPLSEFVSMFSTPQLTLRTLVCFYIWFTVSAVYFGLVMNGNNFSIDRFSYILLNGILEIFSYALPVPLLSVCGRKAASLYLFFFTGAGLISILFLPKTLNVVILVVALFSRFCVTSVYVIFALYTSELFPTAIRNTAIGASITMSHVGTLVSPYIVDILGPIKWYIPSTMFGLFAVFSMIAVLPLPETKNQPLFSTVEEMNEEAASRTRTRPK